MHYLVGNLSYYWFCIGVSVPCIVIAYCCRFNFPHLLLIGDLANMD